MNCDEPLAPGDVIACTWHRAQLDALVMPWERATAEPTQDEAVRAADAHATAAFGPPAGEGA